MILRFSILPERFAIARLAADAAVPELRGEFFSITRTAEELSVIREEADGEWRCLALQGPFALTEIGIAAEFTRVLAEARVAVLVVSTYDTDYVLVAADEIDRAVAALLAAGHDVTR